MKNSEDWKGAAKKQQNKIEAWRTIMPAIAGVFFQATI